MIIGGLQKFTLLDYPGQISAVVFTKGCNLRCPYCHNAEIVDPKLINYEESISEKEIMKFLETRRGDLDGVCITGGEPTLQVGLSKFIERIKEMGFLVKLDTNATKFAVVKNLIDADLVDYWAIDIKTIPVKYKILGDGDDIVMNIEKSVDLITNKGKRLELRTTVVRGIVNEDDIDEMIKWLNGINAKILPGVQRYSLQEFRPEKTLNEKYSQVVPYPRDIIEKMADKLRRHCKNVIVMCE